MSIFDGIAYSPNYNIGNLQDIIAAKDADTDGERKARAALASAPDATWDSDFAALMSRYADARAKAERYISLVQTVQVIGDYRSTDATSEAAAVLQAIEPAYPALTVTTGGLTDLDARMRSAAVSQGITPPSWTVPQPDATYDEGQGPRSFDAYLTGAGYWLGLVPAADVPPGTPFGPDSDKQKKPFSLPWWLLPAVAASAGLWVATKVKDLLT